jgi:hypothetical protein
MSFDLFHEICVRTVFLLTKTFVRTGAKLLDDELVNASLKWLREEKYENVLKPFEKALQHLLESEK